MEKWRPQLIIRLSVNDLKEVFCLGSAETQVLAQELVELTRWEWVNYEISMQMYFFFCEDDIFQSHWNWKWQHSFWMMVGGLLCQGCEKLLVIHPTCVTVKVLFENCIVACWKGHSSNGSSFWLGRKSPISKLGPGWCISSLEGGDDHTFTETSWVSDQYRQGSVREM